MEIRAYIYIEGGENKSRYCFKCATKKIVAGDVHNFDLALEEGRSGDGNDMRSSPQCTDCGKYFKDYTIG